MYADTVAFFFFFSKKKKSREFSLLVLTSERLDVVLEEVQLWLVKQARVGLAASNKRLEQTEFVCSHRCHLKFTF